MLKTIEIDCAPGNARPDTYIKGVIEGTGLHLRDPISKVFGNWTWSFDVTDEFWRKAQEITKPRIQELYRRGLIRYGSW